MPKEYPSVLDRIYSAQQNINGYQNESQRKTAEIERDLKEIGVISAFQKIIDNRILRSEDGFDKSIYITYGWEYMTKDEGYFLVYNDPTKKGIEADIKAIGVVKTSNGYSIGSYYKENHLAYIWTPNFFNGLPSYSEPIETKVVQKNEVLDNIATVITILNYNQKEKRKGTGRFFRFP